MRRINAPRSVESQTVYIEFRGRRIELEAGTGDDVIVLSNGKKPAREIAVLSLNRRLGYAGIQVFSEAEIRELAEETKAGDEIKPSYNSAFFQNASEELHEGWDEMAETRLAQMMLCYTA